MVSLCEEMEDDQDKGSRTFVWFRFLFLLKKRKIRKIYEFDLYEKSRIRYNKSKRGWHEK